MGTLASVRLRPRLTPLSSTLLTTASPSAPALVLTPSPRDLTPLPRAMLLMLMVTTDTTLASVRLRLTLLSCTLAMLATLTLPSMVLSPTLWPPPLLAMSTLPMLVSAPTISELLSLARLSHWLQYGCLHPTSRKALGTD